MGTTLTITDADFKTTVLASHLPVVVDFWAPWCGPCRAVAPILEELAETMKDKVVITKLNVDDSPETATNYRIMSIPTLMLFKDGKAVSTKVGASSRADIEGWINEHAA